MSASASAPELGNDVKAADGGAGLLCAPAALAALRAYAKTPPRRTRVHLRLAEPRRAPAHDLCPPRRCVVIARSPSPPLQLPAIAPASRLQRSTNSFTALITSPPSRAAPFRPLTSGRAFNPKVTRRGMPLEAMRLVHAAPDRGASWRAAISPRAEAKAIEEAAAAKAAEEAWTAPGVGRL